MGAPWALRAHHSIRQCWYPFDVGRYLTPNPGESDDRPSGRGLLIYWLGLRQWFFCALGGMIVANYASSWVGYLILAAVKGLVQSITLLWLKPFFVVCLGVSFC